MRGTGSIAFAILCCAGFIGCKQQAPQQTTGVEVRRVDGNSFQLVPQVEADSQMKYCLVFTRSQSGVVRQLTMTHENMSVPCEPGQPIAKVRFRAPVNEGDVKVHVFLSDQKLNAGSIAQQLYEKKGDPVFHPMDLRLPGNVKILTAEFKPEGEADAPTVGGEIGAGGMVTPGGQPETVDAGTVEVGVPQATPDAG